MFPSLGREVNFDDRILLLAQGKWVDPDAFNLGNGGMTQAEERTYFGLCKLLTLTPPWMMDHFSVWRLYWIMAPLWLLWDSLFARGIGRVESLCRPELSVFLIEGLGSERDWSAARVPAESAAADGQ